MLRHEWAYQERVSDGWQEVQHLLGHWTLGCGLQPIQESCNDSTQAAAGTGPTVDVDRRTSEGFTLGSVTIENPNGRCAIEFENENLIARADGEVLAIVPDIISILDAETALPITNETLRFGQRVKVMAVGVPPIMRSDAALKQFGPQAFGLTEKYSALS